MNVRNLMFLSRKQLGKFYSKGSFLRYPNGFYRGKPLCFFFGLRLLPLNWLVSLLWKGKNFSGLGRLFSNKIFWFNFFYGRFYLGKSRFDEKSCIVLDYHKSSLIGFFVRDEIRSIGTNLFLGRVYFLKFFTCYFILSES